MAVFNKKSNFILESKEIEVLNTRNIQQQFINDAAVIKTYLKDTEVNHSSTSEETRNIFKRIFMAVDQGHFQFRTDNSNRFNSVALANRRMRAQDPRFTLAATFSHGGRVVFVIPKLTRNQQGVLNDPNEFLNYILGIRIIAPSRSEKENLNTPVYRRSAATHSLEGVNEIHLNPKSPRDWRKFMDDNRNGRHLGIDLGLLTATKVGKEDGHHGHLYLYWKAPTETEEGGLMVGVEGSAPGKRDIFGNKHGPSGKSPLHSPTGGLKFWANKFVNYFVRPARINGARVILTDEDILQLKQKSTDDFDLEKLFQPIAANEMHRRVNLDQPVQQQSTTHILDALTQGNRSMLLSIHRLSKSQLSEPKESIKQTSFEPLQQNHLEVPEDKKTVELESSEEVLSTSNSPKM